MRFRTGRPTSDAIFVLHQIIKKHREFNNKLIHTFIGFVKAFDNVNRSDNHCPWYHIEHNALRTQHNPTSRNRTGNWRLVKPALVITWQYQAKKTRMMAQINRFRTENSSRSWESSNKAAIQPFWMWNVIRIWQWLST